MDAIVNKVTNSGLITLDLETLIHPAERVQYDLAQNLFQGLILKEKNFREFLKNHNWQLYQGKNVFIVCSADAIIPNWAYMLLISKLYMVAENAVVGDINYLNNYLFNQQLAKLNFEEYANAKIVIKGCSKSEIPPNAYAEITQRLLPFAASIMFGEPCSTVPVFKRK